jgi:hypothetical protein
MKFSVGLAFGDNSASGMYMLSKVFWLAINCGDNKLAGWVDYSNASKQ